MNFILRFSRFFFLLLAFQFLGTTEAQEIKIPELTSPVMDLGDFLSFEEEASLGEMIRLMHQKNGPQLTILTVSNLQGQEIEEFSIRVAEKWQLGSKEKDNGILILLARKERKVRIEVGNGIEGEVTDLFTTKYTRNIFPGYFKRGEFYEALKLFIFDVGSKFNISWSQEHKPSIKRSYRSVDNSINSYAFFGIILILILGNAFLRHKPFFRGLFTGLGFTGISFLLGFSLLTLFFIFIFGLFLGIIGIGTFLEALIRGHHGGYGGGGYRGSSGGGWSGGGGGFSGGGSSGSW